jgi:hypothetical protein
MRLLKFIFRSDAFNLLKTVEQIVANSCGEVHFHTATAVECTQPLQSIKGTFLNVASLRMGECHFSLFLNLTKPFGLARPEITGGIYGLPFSWKGVPIYTFIFTEEVHSFRPEGRSEGFFFVLGLPNFLGPEGPKELGSFLLVGVFAVGS